MLDARQTPLILYSPEPEGVAKGRRNTFAPDESSNKMHEPESSDTRDVPLMKNDMNDPLPTTGRPLNSSDAPGKADSEMFEADEILPPFNISP